MAHWSIVTRTSVDHRTDQSQDRGMKMGRQIRELAVGTVDRQRVLHQVVGANAQKLSLGSELVRHDSR
jgi:hypothetical protein